MSYRCFECDSRYCPPSECLDKPGYLYVVGKGWTPEADARFLAEGGREVDGVTRPGRVGGGPYVTPSMESLKPLPKTTGEFLDRSRRS